MTAAWAIWAALSLIGFVVLESIALVDDKPGTTLSAQVWRLRLRRWFRLLLIPPYFWIGWHLILPVDRETWGADDFVAIGVGVLIALLLRYRSRSGA